MSLKHALLGIAASALLIPAAALAEHDGYPTGLPAPLEVHVHDGHCNHHLATPARTPPPGRATNPGRYELRSVDRWVEGRWEQQYVPGQCVEKRHKKFKRHPGKHKVKCSEGYYANHWIPGRYETLQEWVWVPYQRRPGGISVSVNLPYAR